MQQVRLSALALMIGLVAPSAAAKDQFPPPQAEICGATHIIDKDKLTKVLYRKFPVSAEAFEPSNDPALVQFSPARQIFAGAPLADPAACRNCSAPDRDYLYAIRGYMAGLLHGNERAVYAPTAEVDPSIFFRGPNEQNAIRCVAQSTPPAAVPAAVAEKKSKSGSPVRVRGKPEDLYIDRSDKTAFASSSKAMFDISRDNVAKKAVYKIVVGAGYAFEVPLPPDVSDLPLDLIPYFGMNYNITTVDAGSSAKPSVNKSVDVGILFNAYLFCKADLACGHRLSLRPDYLFNPVDDSQLASGQLIYTPVVNSWLNSFGPLPGNFASFKFILNLRDDNGFYTDRGNATVAASHQDFVRLGGQAGLSIVSDNPAIPVTATTSYIRVHPVLGVTEVGYFANTLTWFLDPDKFFGITLSYSNGTREDTVVRESQWEIALSGHF